MKKYIKIISLMLAICAIVSLSNMGGISGFFHDEETLNNELRIGSVETEIVEEYDTKPIVAGDIFKKIVWIKNIGESPCYVRVRILVSPEQYKEELALNIDTVNWEYRNGYYYYKHMLNSGEKTSPLFTQLTIPSGLETGDVFDINIYSESVQFIVGNTDDTKAKKYWEIFELL